MAVIDMLSRLNLDTTVLRTHLERHTYVSGGQEQGGSLGFKRRGYYRPRK